jgi:hypothetical protein
MCTRKVTIRFADGLHVWRDELELLEGETLRVALEDSGFPDCQIFGVDPDDPTALFGTTEIQVRLNETKRVLRF